MTDQPRSVAPVVTLFETYGSGAIQIGARVAEALGVPFLGQRFTSEEVEAGEMKAYEDGPIGRFLSAFGTYSPNQEGVRSTAIGQAQDNEVCGRTTPRYSRRRQRASSCWAAMPPRSSPIGRERCTLSS